VEPRSLIISILVGVVCFLFGALVSLNSQVIDRVLAHSERSSTVTMALSNYTKPMTGSIITDTEDVSGAIKGTVNEGQTKPEKTPDGFFNNIPVYYQNKAIHSTVSCLGENFQEDAWKFRSCKYRNLCFNLQDKDFVIFQSKEQLRFERLATNQGNFTHSSSVFHLNLSIGGINPKWRDKSQTQLKWRPRVVKKELTGGHYEFHPNTVWVPYHSFAGYNVGHLVWDDFFPIFKLLSIFSFVDNDSVLNYQLLMSLIELKMWGTCDWNPKNTLSCAEMFPKFLPAMGLTNETGFSATNRTIFSTADGSVPKSKYVCSPHGVAGIGTLTDHGFKLHGWNLEDYKTTHNVGRGKIFYDFRNFMLRNLDLPVRSEPLSPPYKIVFSKFSSKTKGRVKGFGKQIDILKKNLKQEYVQVDSYRMSFFSLREQARYASEAAVFVSCVGGGAVTATFAPRGSSVIMFYESSGGIRNNRDVAEPARLDWDVLNHASHLRVHWLPVETLDEKKDLNFFLELVKHELDLISHQTT